MSPFVGEIVGTMLLILFGDAIVANVLLNKSKGQNSGWIVITTGWGLAVAMAVYAVGRISGAHINPAVTIGLASIGKFPWADVPLYIVGQFIGAFIGATLVWLAYLPHWAETESQGLKLAVFSTGPAIRNYGANLLTEIIGTFALVFGVLYIIGNELVAGLAPLLIGFLVWVIGLALGGPTGYAINPARDLGPRIAHFVLPIAGKGDSDWAYSWVPVVGPIIGGVVGALLFVLLFGA
ncbi:MAG: Glycerol uptake facilitator protein [Firmicutes bacterium]|uniref:Glycerol uptake facilitator protein n=1 Tax=Candidatus Hakubella thermalkaliphila TaxID=2754717 RepID=A0A6V8QAE1_9ACTN|nr:MIP/aquaporin family protein [Candidatus Hakubella thermalkaliphila]MBT9176072.1 Glycerol uptake facilitator protein [Bacillota bacterium]GFP24939.1 glycerol uptake facilitator protein [Candidatus Hakubella thermalkaliphila]GFP26733.1 glycerol uptake facilitator protein [Candidatus Hakubella thermalkaliphila]GFP40974.1 glycerol uptake facilitator protein [Candidatus Hakubella thermalkaliphila]